MAYQYLQFLIPKSPLVWFSLNEPHPNGDGASVVFDQSGAMRNLSAPSHPPIWQVFPYKGDEVRNNIYFDGDAEPLRRDFAALPQTIKHAFSLVMHNGNGFGSEYRGLMSGLDDTNYGILTGNAATTRFFNFGYSSFGTYQYKKSQISYAENNQQAPFGKPELVEVSYSAGWLLDGLQIGQDRENENRRWLGSWGETICFGRVLTQNEVAAVNLYYDLKHSLWLKNGTTLNFPNPSICNIPYAFFYAEPEDASKVIQSHEYEDGGKSFNRSSDTAPRSWQLEFDCTGYTHAESKLKTDVFDAFFSAVWFDKTFDFTDKYGVTHREVRVADYNRDHQRNKSWSQNAKFKLVKLP